MTTKLSMFIPAEADVFSQLWDNVAFIMAPELVLFLVAMGSYAVLFNLKYKKGHDKFNISSKVCVPESGGVACQVKCCDQIELVEETSTDVIEEYVTTVVEESALQWLKSLSLQWWRSLPLHWLRSLSL